MTEKRFYIDNDGDLYDRQSNKLLMLDFGYSEAIYVNCVLDCLNALHEENQELKRKVKSMSKELCNCEEDYIYEEW